MKPQGRAILVAAALAISGAHLAAQWPQFRGPDGNGHVAERRPAPDVG